MDIIIIYFSGTGNTELLAHELSQRLAKRGNNVELISIEDQQKIEETVFPGKIIGFGFPVYKLSYPDSFKRLFNNINQKGRENPVFLFSTYARFTSDSFNQFKKRLDGNKFSFIAEQSFKSPSCGISARKDESDFEYQSVMFFEDDINEKLNSFVQKITEKKPVRIKTPISLNPFKKLKQRIVTNIEQTKYPLLQINHSKCIQCGLCVGKCPDKNLTFTDKNNENQIEIIDTRFCLHCLRCMNHCPGNAINFGLLTVGENRYTLKKRDQLFKRSLSGYKDPSWDNFKKNIYVWRKNTIKYWLKHRMNPEI